MGVTTMGVPLQGVASALDTFVLERRENGRFQPLTDVPDWAGALVPGAANGESQLCLAGTSDFLDHFLEDADSLWAAARDARQRSGPWVEVDDARGEWPFEATAISHGGREFLLLRALGDEYEKRVARLQSAHLALLSNEELERRVRDRTATLRRREEEIALRLMTACGIRDGETGGHIRRIGLYAVAMTRALGWTRAERDDIRIAAPMHDIGKIGIPDHILLKPGRLTPIERAEMERHAEIGASMLACDDIPLLQMAESIAWAHHERWDGTGYPRGLKGEEIPLPARITTIVDVYDAMIHERVYKPAVPEAKVIQWMKKQSGRIFDPKLLKLFFSLLPEMQRIRIRVPDADSDYPSSLL